MRTRTPLTCLILLAGAAWGWGQDDRTGDLEERAQRIVAERKRQQAELARQPTSLDGGETVNPVILRPILDNSVGLRFEERDAYFRALELARQTPLAEQESYARDFRDDRWLSNPLYAKHKPSKFPVFWDMVNHPDVYRGRLVSLHGVMRKLTKFSPGEDSRGIQDVYEGWVYTDGSRSNPTVVIFLGKPDELTVGGDLTEEVRLTGYFFKMYRYESQEKFWKAPLVIAGAVEWKKREVYKPEQLGIEVYLLITLVVVVLGFVWWQGNRREMASAIHPAPPDTLKLPPLEHPIKESAVKIGSKLTEPHDS